MTRPQVTIDILDAGDAGVRAETLGNLCNRLTGQSRERNQYFVLSWIGTPLHDELANTGCTLAGDPLQGIERDRARLGQDAKRTDAQPVVIAFLEWLQSGEDRQKDCGRRDADDVEAAADRQADCGDGPKARCGGEPFDDFAAKQDRPGPGEADT